MASLFELTIVGTMQSQQIINRLNFVSDIEDPDADNSVGLINALGYDAGTPGTPIANKFFDRFLEAQTTQYQVLELLARNIFEVTDFYTLPVSGSGWAGTITVGAGAGPLMFSAQKLRTNRVRQDIGRGTLALTSPSEAEIEGAGVVTSGQLAKLQAVCDALNAPPLYNGGGEDVRFRPSVLQKMSYEVEQAPPKLPTTAYKYWPDKDDQLQHTALGVTWSPVARITSQTSRKIGKGA